MTKLERLAAWYLRRRGRVVLPVPFVGMAIGGNALALRHRDGFTYTVMLQPGAPVVVMSGSSVIDRPELESAAE